MAFYLPLLNAQYVALASDSLNLCSLGTHSLESNAVEKDVVHLTLENALLQVKFKNCTSRSFKNSSAHAISNSQHLELITVSRGTRQGCLFITMFSNFIKPLAEAIRLNSGILSLLTVGIIYYKMSHHTAPID